MRPDIFFSDYTDQDFCKKALEIFCYQAQHNPIYADYLKNIGCDVASVTSLDKIPFLPISFFKTHDVITEEKKPQKVFLSSGTTGSRSRHLVADIDLYEQSFRKGFAHFFGNVEEYSILALLPSYVEQEHSSLIYMVTDMIRRSKKQDSGFYTTKSDKLIRTLLKLENREKKTLLIGISYALLDLIAIHTFNLQHTLVMETGGMKGRKKELVKSELHHLLKKGFGATTIYSEYGMTELLSQAYSLGDELFCTPPWMKVLICELEDPFTLLPKGKTGGINIIDFANVASCSFVATQDIGRLYPNGKFKILGRYDHSDIRGCNLIY